MEFKLREWENEDLGNLVKYANNKKIASKLTNKFTYPYTEENGKWFINFSKSHNPRLIFAIDIEGQAVGSIGVHPQEDIFRKNAELGYWLAEPYWGRGIITSAIERMVDYGFKTFDLDRIFARPFGSNIGSQRVLEKAGFKLEAKFESTIYKMGQYEDELVYAIRKKK